MSLDAIVYTRDGVADYDDLDEAKAARGTTWIRAIDPTAAELDALYDATDVHPLVVEDVQNGVRPKVEEFDDHTFVLLTVAEFRRGDTTFEEELDDTPVGLVIGDDWLVTLAFEPLDAVDRTWQVVRREDARVLSRGPDFAAYRVADYVVDGYFGLLDAIEDRLEAIEDAIIDEPEIGTLEEINHARRELLSVRKLLWPSREAAGILARGDPEQVREPTEKYYRDVYDHLVQLVDLVETYRDLASGARDIYLNALSVSTNEVMKKLTVVATIVLPLTFVVGVYGMNFGDSPWNMPELGWTYGYPAVMVGMGLVAVILLAYFRREDWL